MRPTTLLLSALLASAIGACDGAEQANQNRSGQLPSCGGRTEIRKGSEIAFTRIQRPKPRGTIWVMRADGSGRKRITNNPDANDASPSFSPDGKLIAFSRSLDRGRGPSQTYLMCADGSEVTRLSDMSGFSPEISPDGKRIAFNRQGSGSGGIYVMDIDGSNVVQLTGGRRDVLPTWSPDGDRIAFARSENDIHVINADGTGHQSLTAGAAFNDLLVTSPSFFPDGRRIAFLALRKGGTDSREVWMMSADGSNPAPFPDRPQTGLAFGPPSFSPDGRRIAYVGGGVEVYVMRANGSRQYRLPGGRINDGEPTWSPAADGLR